MLDLGNASHYMPYSTLQAVLLAHLHVTTISAFRSRSRLGLVRYRMDAAVLGVAGSVRMRNRSHFG